MRSIHTLRRRRLERQRKAAGLCCNCGREPARPNRRLGETCAERLRQKLGSRAGKGPNAWEERTLAARRCLGCGKPRQDLGKTHCDFCRQRAAERMQRKRDARGVTRRALRHRVSRLAA